MKFWLGVVTAALTVGPVATPNPTPVTETFVETVQVGVEPELFVWEPLPMDVEEHAQCMIALIDHLGLELTVQNLFIVGDFADLQGGPCLMLP